MDCNEAIETGLHGVIQRLIGGGCAGKMRESALKGRFLAVQKGDRGGNGLVTRIRMPVNGAVAQSQGYGRVVIDPYHLGKVVLAVFGQKIFERQAPIAPKPDIGRIVDPLTAEDQNAAVVQQADQICSDGITAIRAEVQAHYDGSQSGCQGFNSEKGFHGHL